jgi:osmotically-inducible protein OsmY
MRVTTVAAACLATALIVGSAPLGHAADQSPPAGTRADDTAKNVRDRDGTTATSDKQSTDPKDVEITRRIRRAITKDGSMSTNARNVKIITVDRQVTLRGPVNSAKEKAMIAKRAQKIAGADKVDDQLEIAKP